LDVSSFQLVTGPKVDLWLVRTVGLLLVVLAGAFFSAAFRRVIVPEIAVIGIGTALALAAIDFIYTFTGRISAIYLLDGLLEIVFLAVWVSGGIKNIRRMKRSDEFNNKKEAI
jgi:hypothetical protein